ncbi:MAG TPA: hypothetical protein VE093_05650 [Polyangiaceae bacterium]|jgi:hypothetical protein|nr:hypothetical protein [Polyangiaceae bacterium]
MLAYLARCSLTSLDGSEHPLAGNEHPLDVRSIRSMFTNIRSMFASINETLAISGPIRLFTHRAASNAVR